MSQPQYEGTGFDSGNTPSVDAYLSPASVAPVVDCVAAVDAAIARRDGLEAAMSAVTNMSDRGTHAGPIGVDNDGVTNTIGPVG